MLVEPGQDERLLLARQYRRHSLCFDTSRLDLALCPTLRCNVGCANRRLRAKHLGEAGREFCSPYRDHLIAYLEAYLDILRSKEICAALLRPGSEKRDARGYRVVAPGQ